jgi:hypothetical protein
MKRLLLCLFVVGLVACSGDVSPSATPVPAIDTALLTPGAPIALATPITNIPNPESGQATVRGMVRAEQVDVPMVQTFVFLAPVTRQDSEAIFVLDTANSPTTTTASDGSFVIQNIMPGEYVIIVGNPHADYEIITDETEHPKVWNFDANQINDVERLVVDLPISPTVR